MPPLATGPLQPEEADLMRGPSTPLSEVIESFLLAQVNLSPRTLDGYAQNLRAFDRWLGGGRVRDLHPDAVNAYVIERKATSPHGARYSAATIKAFASWLAQRGYLVASGGGSALATVRIPRVPKGGRTAYSDADLALIFRTIERQSHRTRARDRALVMFLLGTGLRLNEARELDLSDVHIERPIEKSHILVRAATSKSMATRSVRLDPSAAAAIAMYIDETRPERPGPLFLTEEGKGFTRAGMTTYLGRLRDRMEAAGVRDFMAHRCRHTWATLYHRMGSGTLYDLQREGGWRDLEMPRRYTHDRPFEELQRIPTGLTAWMRKVG